MTPYPRRATPRQDEARLVLKYCDGDATLSVRDETMTEWLTVDRRVVCDLRWWR